MRNGRLHQAVGQISTGEVLTVCRWRDELLNSDCRVCGTESCRVDSTDLKLFQLLVIRDAGSSKGFQVD